MINNYTEKEIQLRILKDIMTDYNSLPKLFCLKEFLGWSTPYAKEFIKEHKKEANRYEKKRAAEYATLYAAQAQAKVELAPQTLITETGTCDCGGSCGNV